ncbi:thioredoxin domain-containing protein [Sphaerothrix gracilis]|uniref:thioredoxin domain-containing protein n=1 Tax=Sphaerothrix gracilis TaxID=3151835 RepID=UPI0031FBB49A
MSNRLAQSQSLYLRKHADNPVDWWPWCDQALALAEQEDRPIFLSIGYSSCHWCTVMEGEAFSDPAIASYLNSHFVPIKVDREERPDIDSLYMQALQLMTGQGGWPLNVFLSPSDRVPFYGGTYFPAEPKYGRPGFLQVLQALHQFYTSRQGEVETVKSQILANLQGAAGELPAAALSAGLLKSGLTANVRLLKPTPGNSFPMIPQALAALRYAQFETSAAPENAYQLCYQRGLDLALGGIYDHVAGGFHRYTVDPTWTVPHFEKMLYDNGQIVEYLAELWSAGVEEPAFERAIAGTVQWLQREMMAPAGYFYAAQDADSFIHAEAIEPEEGAFYIWRYDELQALLSEPELQQLTEQFTVSEAGNFEGANVLQRQQPGELSQAVISALTKLFTHRYGTPPTELKTCLSAQDNQAAKSTHWPGRIPPVTDTKMIVAWNSLMISGLAKAAAVFNQQAYLELAGQVAQFILTHQWQGDRLHRLNYGAAPVLPAQAEDYACLVKALLDIQQAQIGFDDCLTETDWLAAAAKVQAEFDQNFWDEKLGGYQNTAEDASENLLVRERTYQDSAIPAANGVAVSNLIRLALLSEDLSYLDRAEQSLQAFSTAIAKAPRACPSLLTGLDSYYHHTLVRSDAQVLRSLLPEYWPTSVYKLEKSLPADSVGLVCQGLTCQAPATSQTELRQQLAESILRLAEE